MLGKVVSFAPREQLRASQECSLPWFTIPLNTPYIKVKHCLLLNSPIFYLRFLHDNFNDDALLPPSHSFLSFPFSFLESISWFNFFSCGFFSCSLFPAVYFYFIFNTAYSQEFEGFLSSFAASHSTVVFLIVTSRCWHLSFLVWFWLDAAKRSYFTMPSGFLLHVQYLVHGHNKMSAHT